MIGGARRPRLRENLADTEFIDKVIQSHRFWYQSKAHMQLPVND